jgi:hypothetical protein
MGALTSDVPEAERFGNSGIDPVITSLVRRIGAVVDAPPHNLKGTATGNFNLTRPHEGKEGAL